jgi:hypothetical protein
LKIASLMMVAGASIVATAGCTIDASPTPSTGPSNGPSTGGEKSGGGGNNSGNGGGGSEATVNGKPASEFYAQLTNEETGGYLTGAGSFSAVENGDNAFLVDLFLLKGGKYILYYTEGQGEVSGTGHSLATKKDRNRKVSGEWSVNSTTLLVGDVFACEGLSLNGHSAVRCQLKKTIGYEAAVGRGTTLEVATSSRGKITPDDSQWAEYK